MTMGAGTVNRRKVLKTQISHSVFLAMSGFTTATRINDLMAKHRMGHGKEVICQLVRSSSRYLAL